MLDPDKAIALGVKPGRAFAQLKAGQAVETAAGRTVQPSEVWAVLEAMQRARLQQAGWCCRPAACRTVTSKRGIHTSDRCWEAAALGGDCWCLGRASSRRRQQ